jgi:outer membrane protein W
MVPLMATVNYDLVNPGSKIWPVFGIGMSLMGKADHNRDFQKTHYSLTYGYQASAGLKIKVKNHLVLILNLGYNLMMVPVPEELNISGVSVTFGIRVPVRKTVK